jgi:HK97 family phage portal protein
MDNFFANMFRKREAAPAPINGVPGVPDSTLPANTPAQGSGSFQENIIIPGGFQSSLTIGAFHRAVTLEAKTVSQFEPQFQKKDFEKDNFTIDMRGYGKQLNYLMQVQPNPVMTAATFWQQMCISRHMTGNAYAYMERDEFDMVKAIWWAGYGAYNLAANTYTLTFSTDKGIRNRVEVPSSDVIHWPNTFREPNGYLGIPTIRFILSTLALSATEKQQALEIAGKGGRMKLIIGEDQTGSGVSPIAMGLFDKKEMDKYAQEIESKLYKNDVLAIRALKSVQNISISPAEQQLVELLGVTVDDIARFMGTPRPLLMADTNSHYNSYEQATMEYLTRTIQPLVQEVEQEVTRKFLTYKDFGVKRFHMCEIPLLRLDKKAQAEVDEKRLRTGTATVNELRKQYDMPAVKDGDIVYVLTNLAELGSAKLRDVAGGGRPTTEPAQQPAAKEGEEKK